MTKSSLNPIQGRYSFLQGTCCETNIKKSISLGFLTNAQILYDASQSMRHYKLCPVKSTFTFALTSRRCFCIHPNISTTQSIHMHCCTHGQIFTNYQHTHLNLMQCRCMCVYMYFRFVILLCDTSISCFILVLVERKI